MTQAELFSVYWPYTVAVIALLAAGLYCVLASVNLVRILIGLEVLIKGVTLFLILAGYMTGHEGLTQSFVITLIVVEIVLMVVANGIVLNVYKEDQSIDTGNLKRLKG